MAVAKAIEIITDDGTGIPVTYNNTAIGLASDGHFYLISDRHGIDGSKVITGDTSRDTWYEGILGKSKGIVCTRSIDIVEGGNLSSFSSFQFSVINTSLFWNTLNTNLVYLGRCTIKYYHVTSSDGVTFDFKLRWTGVIEDQPFNELTYSIQCIENSKAIFKSAPPSVVDSTTFPLAAKESLDKTIPIALGRVGYSPLTNVISSGERIDLITVDGVSYPVAAATSWVEGTKTLTLYTKGKSFQATDVRLTGNYITVIKGGDIQTRKIISNTATNSTSEQTAVVLDDVLDAVSPIFVQWNASNSDNVWYFKVTNYSATLIASTLPIYSYENYNTDLPALYSFNSSTGKYEDNSETRNISSTSNINSTNYPGLKIIAKSQDTDGSINVYYAIQPSDIILRPTLFVDSSDLPAVGESCPRLFDLDRDSNYLMSSDGQAAFNFEVRLPLDKLDKDLEVVYLLFDFRDRNRSTSAFRDGYITIYGKDVYGVNTSEIVNAHNFRHATVGTGTNNFEYRLPYSYYGLTSGDDSGFFADREIFDITTVISDLKSKTAYPVLIVEFFLDGGAPSNIYDFYLYEIGIVAKKTLNFSSEQAYTSLIGETFGSTWQGRKTAANPILNLTDTVEGLIRKYDLNYPVWKAGTAYAIGTIIKTIADNGHLYICTVAGTSHASTEPTFPTTAGATVTDNTVTWTEHKTIPIQTSTFDAMSVQRPWPIGRTLTEKKKTSDYLIGLAKQGFFGIITNPAGQISVKAWRENTTPTVTFNITNIIKGSLGDMTPTPMSRVSNDIVIKYDFNHGSNSYNKQIFITKTDRPAFPSSTDFPGSINPVTVSFIAREGGIGFYIFEITTATDHGLNPGDYCTLSGCSNGFDFPLREVLGTGPSFLIVFGHLTSSPTGGGGSLSKANSGRFTWQEYVGGVENYATAAALWNKFRASYIVCKSLNPLPEEMGHCPWFIDPYATDPNGSLLWPDLPVGDEHPAVFLARNISEWTAFQKKQISFEVEDSPANLDLELLDPVDFNDAKLTNAVDRLGWIYEISDIEGDGQEPDRLKISVILNPDQLVACDTITDTAGAADTLTDIDGSADSITDVPC